MDLSDLLKKIVDDVDIPEIKEGLKDALKEAEALTEISEKLANKLMEKDSKNLPFQGLITKASGELLKEAMEAIKMGMDMSRVGGENSKIVDEMKAKIGATLIAPFVTIIVIHYMGDFEIERFPEIVEKLDKLKEERNQRVFKNKPVVKGD